jgi:hypothetical protein
VSEQTYELRCLTDQWEWEEEISAPTLEAAKEAARAVLERIVREEAPEIACITLVLDGGRMGVWDWIDGQPHWSLL